MIRVVIADDHHLVRQGIRALLERAGDITVVGEADDGQKAVELAEQLTPDVLVIDISMPRLNGIQATELLRQRGLATRVVILSVHNEPTLVRQALRHGATAYLLKDAVTEELLLAIRAANEGKNYLSPAISGDILAGYLSTQHTSPLDQLSLREREVLKLIAEGHTNAEIAGLLHISAKTVEKHRANGMAKLNVHDLAGLIRAALKYGLIFLDE